MIFTNRVDAGQQLAEKLVQLNLSNPYILGLARGGVPVAFEVARRLHAPLQPLITRKIGAPHNPEYGIGAISEHNEVVWQESALAVLDISKDQRQQLLARQQEELERRVQAYRQKKPIPSLKDNVAILVDDGLATGVSAHAAIKAVRHHQPKKIILAVPVCATQNRLQLTELVDNIICLHTTSNLQSVGMYYQEFTQVSDDQVISLIKQSNTNIGQLKSTTSPYDPLISSSQDKRLLMLGEATHGTHEFYTIRADISKRLIQEAGYQAIAVEGDWPACYQIDRFIKGHSSHDSAQSALTEFTRWPSWMWANWEMIDFIDWLHEHNQDREPEDQVGFYGLDVYSLWESLEEIIRYIKRTDSSSLDETLAALKCFEPFQRDVYAYAKSTALVPDNCQEEVIDLLTSVRSQTEVFTDTDQEAQFNLEQNAHVLKNAEAYYRNMVTGRVNIWNLRDTHMMETITRLLQFIGPQSKLIVWAHNTHIGDAAYTSMKASGEINIGQLAREQHGRDQVQLVGFSTYKGTVIAAKSWNAPHEILSLPPAKSDSWDNYFHQKKEKFIDTKDLPQTWKGHRAVGVVYHPENESGNYVPTNINNRYDSIIFVDQTRALSPLFPSSRDFVIPQMYPYSR